MTSQPPDPGPLATELSVALKDLHRALIRAELGDDPALKNPYTALFALIGDPRFAWMGALSSLITSIDAQLADAETSAADTLAAARDGAVALLGGTSGDPAEQAFRARHIMALQNEPEVGLATGRLRKVLAGLPLPPREPQ